MQVVVSGSHGLIGSEMLSALKRAGHRPIRLIRSAPGPGDDAIRWDPAVGEIDKESLEGVDGVIHLAGKNIGRLWWTPSHIAQVLDSRVRGTRLLAETLAALNRPPRVLVSQSASGYYGERGDEVLRESSGPGDGLLANICMQWEASTEPATAAGIRVAKTRTAIVLGGRGGATAPLVHIFRLGLGGPIGPGAQYWPWISIDDEVLAMIYTLEGDLSGPVNFVAQSVRNAEFARVLAKVLNRPAIVPAPSFAIKLVVGPDMAREMLLVSQRMVPERLLADGYRFRFPDLEGALRHVLNREERG
jgi:uncharacterized protein